MIAIHERVVAVAFFVLLGACAQSRPPIDRVQPNVVDKQYLDGEWYFQSTIIRTPQSENFVPVGNTGQSGVRRIRWDIQENYLYARQSIEFLVNSGEDVASEGEVVAAFRIDSHFDVQREYNSTTGEEINVVSENTNDRPWFERRYIRVDWSRNSVTDLNFSWANQGVESVPYFVQDVDPSTGEIHPDAPVFEEDYFDLTNKFFDKAGTIEVPGYGEVPRCQVNELAQCSAMEYTVRNSFKRIDTRVETRYEPRPYKGRETDAFGFFATDRYVYHDRHGVRVQELQRFLNRRNLWRESYQADGTPLPLNQRQAVPVVYHVNRQWPSEDATLTQVAIEVADQWNEVLVETVELAGATLPEGERMLILCTNNPVQMGDPSECGAPGTTARLGDIRYSFFAYVPEYMAFNLLGYGPTNIDPATGEVLSGMVYVYHHNNLAAQQVLEMAEILVGLRDVNDYVDGVDLEEWRSRVQNRSAAGSNAGITQTHPIAQAFVEHLANGPEVQYWAGERYAISEADRARQRNDGFGAFMTPFMSDLYDRGFNNGTRVASHAKLASLAGTEIEELLLDDEIIAAMGYDPRLPTDDATLDRISLLRGGLTNQMKLDRARQELNATQRMYTRAMADDALLGMARELAERNLSSEEMLEEIRAAIYASVLSHELGHTLGLSHNFAASEDAINYHPQYWTYRDDGQLGPRMNDPITDEEVNARIYDYATSSVMDYPGRVTLGHVGAGAYDRAAVNFGYANKVEVFESRGSVPHEDFREWFQSGGDILYLETDAPRAVHYTSFYERMDSDLYVDQNRVWLDTSELQDDLSMSADGRSRVPYLFCGENRVDRSDKCLTRDFGADNYERMINLLDELNSWYIVRNFPRGIVGRDNVNFISRHYGRLYERLAHWKNTLGLYKGILPRFYEPEALTAFYNDPVDGWGAKVWSVQAAYNQLLQTVLMPDIGYGGYEARQQFDGSVVMQETQDPDYTVRLDVTNGRYFQTSWIDGQSECGYYWDQCLHHVGFYLDKVMAIYALSDSETDFVDLNTAKDLRQYEISYYSLFPDQLERASGAIIAGDWRHVAPYWAAGKVHFPNYADALNDSHASPVDPATTFTVQLFWQVLGAARFHDNLNLQYDQKAAFYTVGTGSSPSVHQDYLAVFTDPYSRISYAALRYPQDYSSSGTGVAEQLLDRANTLLSISSLCDKSGSTQQSGDNCTIPPIETCVIYDGCDPSTILPAVEGGTFNNGHSCWETVEDCKASNVPLVSDYIQTIQIMAKVSSRLEFGAILGQ